MQLLHSLIVLAALAPASVLGHASCNPSVAAPNSYFKTDIRIGHGCDGSTVTGVTVVIPDGVTSVKPRSVAGWQVNMTTRPLEPPVVSHGKTINTTIDTISWSGGNLLDTFFEDFGVSMKLPNKDDGSILYFNVTQTCVNGSISWDQIPQAGSNATLEYPAAKVVLRKNNTLLNAADIGTTTANSKSAAVSINGVPSTGLMATMIFGLLGALVF